MNVTTLTQAFTHYCEDKGYEPIIVVQSNQMLGGLDLREGQLGLCIQPDSSDSQVINLVGISAPKNDRTRWIYGPTYDAAAVFNAIYFALRVK